MGMALSSIQIEKHAIGGLIQNQQIISEVINFLTDRDFTVAPHSVLYSCLRSSFLKGEKLDNVLLAQKIKSLGISFKDKINIFDYVESISFAPITPLATIQSCQELVKLRALREVHEVCEEMQDHIQKSTAQELDKTLNEVDAMYGGKINSFISEKGPVNLFDSLLDLAEERGNKPQEEIGLATPYPEFNRFYGGLRDKNLYIIASRAKNGKSTFLNEICSEMSRLHKIPVLYLDTEMSTEETRFRTMAAKSGVPMWYIETGNWRRNPEFVKMIREADALKKENPYRVTHYPIGNKKIEEVITIVRHWYLKYVGRGNKCLICFDYVKMIDKLTGNQQEYQAMGDKIDALKKLAEELSCPIITAVQSNRTGITTNKDVSELVDDESTIGISDRISWYATYVGILRRRVADEIVLDTPESGTHKLIEAVARFQGKDAKGHQDMMKRTFPDGTSKYVKNFINFQIENFRVTERGSLEHSIQRQNNQFHVHDDKPKSSDTL